MPLKIGGYGRSYQFSPLSPILGAGGNINRHLNVSPKNNFGRFGCIDDTIALKTFKL